MSEKTESLRIAELYASFINRSGASCLHSYACKALDDVTHLEV